MSIRETRAVTIDQAEVRKADEGTLRFTGHAAVFNKRTWIGPKRWGFWEEVDPGFFDDVLQDRAAFLVNHDPNIVLARNGSTMTLAVDDVGLVPDAQWDAADPDAVTWAGRVRRGDVNEMSFAFTVKEEKWSETESGEEVRLLLKADQLYDVSLVTYPAYDGTDAAMRDAAAEVVKRHRGSDPRIPVLSVAEVNERMGADVAALVSQRRSDNAAKRAQAPSVASLRHQLLGKYLGLTERGVTIEIGDDEEDEDEDFSTDSGLIQELIENYQDSIDACVEYLAESDPDVRSADVVTIATDAVTAMSAEVGRLGGILPNLSAA